jgi:hypothetical protein
MARSKWWEVYAGDDEKRVFVGKDGRGGLCRSRFGSGWRTLSALVAETGLTTAEVEAILTRYVVMGMVLRHEDGYACWEFVAPDRNGVG